ncbi:hypothetical protein, partial [Tatumella ptyseos]|uniref:hypothetical protein n=1 Tax=Tatumella ptyseos TaxID=82987 RepID=UPI001C25426D
PDQVVLSAAIVMAVRQTHILSCLSMSFENDRLPGRFFYLFLSTQAVFDYAVFWDTSWIPHGYLMDPYRIYFGSLMGI